MVASDRPPARNEIRQSAGRLCRRVESVRICGLGPLPALGVLVCNTLGRDCFGLWSTAGPVFAGIVGLLAKWGGWGSNPRPRDYEVSQPHPYAHPPHRRGSGRTVRPLLAESSSVTWPPRDAAISSVSSQLHLRTGFLILCGDLDDITLLRIRRPRLDQVDRQRYAGLLGHLGSVHLRPVPDLEGVHRLGFSSRR